MAIVLVAGTISTTTMIPTASFAQSYDDSYAKDKKASNLNKQNVNCNNIIINGIDSAGQGSDGDMINDMTNDENDGTGQWLGNGEKDLNGINENIVNFCKNKNTEVVLAPEPQTGSLTIPKQIFGCNIFGQPPGGQSMDCQQLGPDSDQWLSCDDATISGTVYCQELQENFFDIEVRDDQGNLVQAFTGSQDGTTIQNLEPGTYTVKEIVHNPGGPNQLSFDSFVTPDCTNDEGFVSGGVLPIVQGEVLYEQICFEIEDEQGEDCSTTAIAAGETKTCTVKNYIVFAENPDEL